MNEKKTVCFGEILWDVFPDGERIGGAPLNVASRLRSFGLKTEIISQVGKDERGNKILSYLEAHKVGVGNISVSPQFPTGVVNVNLSDSGSARYEIAYPAAWDKIMVSEEKIHAVEKSSVFIFGSLACRDEVSRETLLRLLPKASFKVLDLNLRPPHYSGELLISLLQQADFIKFNDEELFEVATLLGTPYHSLEQNISFISAKTTARSICVTKGSHGAVLLYDGAWYYNSGFKIAVKDTVGAGDSFLAALLAKLLSGAEVQHSLDFACAVGALVAGKEGANPQLNEEMVKEFMLPERE